MSRSGKAAIGTLLLLVVLVGGAYALDRWAAGQAEERIETEAATAFPDADGLDASIEGALFLPQMITGSLETVRLTADFIQYEGTEFTDVTVTAAGVGIEAPRTVTDLTMTATLPPGTVQTLVQQSGRVPDGVTIDVADGALLATATVLGVPLEATLTPVVESGELRLEPDTFTLGGLEVDAGAVPGDLLGDLAGIDVPLDALPEALALESVETTGSDVLVRVTGTDVAFDDLG
ncbi:DUF2993 domain-containing protein [Ruania suaedae]|uniref:LmeA family phospholipid-binding protein n=1 Tax=Ruania suaedae TaxID=2897774 RepID=UPI001E47FDEF|nr:DUF2993 domain-containing protein [Ruania suaedae]UFU02812.1 DUF2993 domain-containing protein [Ruania suaedae]